MSNLTRLVPLVAAGAALLVLATAPPVEAGPRDGRTKHGRVERDHGKPGVHRQDRDRDHGYRHDDRRGGGRDRGYRHDGRRAPRYRTAPPLWCAPPPRAWCGNDLRVVAVRPWWEGARRVVVQGTPYFFHAGLGVYVGGVGLSIEIGNIAPAGYGYVDPYCGVRFDSLSACRSHAGAHGHDAVVELVAWAD